jgi:hypothetical protein
VQTVIPRIAQLATLPVSTTLVMDRAEKSRPDPLGFAGNDNIARMTIYPGSTNIRSRQYRK